ncbi:MAG TPA: Crp/Fnr family transcriptional regulator [Candidatus Obscuribacter sp.]|nr:Crp/Fnr family transcriptional regulator [Candidatus Melainabacteria bacterium]MBK8223734.1 Crp/Fnr family transcriptional regulator [Candidatus Obscuribacter sp.]MBK9276830.1 Crp/Fnr family transcriptional regulator [Candidatus Obscuribacter sp.]MBL8081887.1 Crp/Fnr family transcriptional regulator [Candidatus Obscuribacter sp.]MDX1990227.1 Crp/Fnr family transcriptional regulator [Candidatus Obscuribacter sp.]
MKGAQRLFSLRQSEIFESFNPVELGRLLGILEELELPKHHLIFSPGTPCDAIYFIEKGRVRVTRLSTEGKTVILALLGPGDMIGEAAWETDEHDSYAETLEDSRIYQIGREAFLNFVRENPEFGLRFIGILGDRLKQAQARIEDLVFRQVPSRVARLLVTLAETHGKVTPNGVRVEFPLTHQEIADMVGSSRVTVTQILNRFRDSHWIDIESKRVTIHNMNALEELVRHL